MGYFQATIITVKGNNGSRDIGTFETFIPQVIIPASISLKITGATSDVNLGSVTVTDIDEIGLQQ